MDNTHYAQKVFAMRNAQKKCEMAQTDDLTSQDEYEVLMDERLSAEKEVDELTDQILTPPQALKVSEINFMDATDSK